MTDTILGPCAPKDEPPHGWGVLLAVLACWGVTLRLMLLLCIPIAAVVVIVALVVIYLGAVGVGALVTLGGGGYGVRWLLAYRSRRSTSAPPADLPPLG
jgi:hypothetical protein